MKNKELRDIIQSHLHEKGWDILYKLEIEIAPTENLVEACIDPHNWNIKVQVDPNVEKNLELLLAKNGMAIANSRKKLLCAASSHEEGHWSICPYDIDYFEDILYGISTGLKSTGLKEEEVVNYTPDVANLFMDYLDNTVKAFQENSYGEGIGVFYLNQLNSPTLKPEYALFVDAQMKVFGAGEEDKHGLLDKLCAKQKMSFRSMAEFYGEYSKIEKNAQKLASTIIPPILAEKAYQKPLDKYDAKQIIDELGNKKSWAKKAEEFAKVYAPYAKEFCQNNDEDSDDENENSGKQNKGKQSQGKPKDAKTKKNKKGHSGIVKRFLEDPEQRKEIIKRALQKGRKAGSEGIPYTSKQDSYEAAYELAAEEIVLKYFKDSDDDENLAYDLFYMRNRHLDKDEPLKGQMNWAKTYFVPNGESQDVWLHKKEIPYQIEEELLPGRKSIEDILYVVDVSGSMGWTQQALDGSKYDLAVQAIFGSMKSLEKMGRAAHAKYGLVLFSNTTEFSGWEDYYSLDKFKKLVFTGYQGGGTDLNAEIMKKTLDGNKSRFLMVLITDGDILNSNAPQIVKNIIDSGNDVVQFSIQGSTDFSDKISKYGAKIVPVDKQEDLKGIVIEKFKERYQ